MFGSPLISPSCPGCCCLEDNICVAPCSLVLWFSGSLVFWFSGSLVLWFCSKLQGSMPPLTQVEEEMHAGNSVRAVGNFEFVRVCVCVCLYVIFECMWQWVCVCEAY